MKILILGSSGMLGSTLIKYFSTKKVEVFGTYRNQIKKKEFFKIKNLKRENFIAFDLIKNNKVVPIIDNIKPDFVINALGLIKQKKKISKQKMYLVNSKFPKLLGRLALKKNFKLLHISTDCVFSGKKGMYNETDKTDAKDDYGKSKARGEIINKNSLTIRTSIIGHEISSKDSLLEKFISKKISVGYENVYFSGFTTLELSKIIFRFFLNKNIYKIDKVIHIASNRISKFDLLNIIKKKYKININLKRDSNIYLDRSLDSSLFNKSRQFKPKSWNKMIKEMYEFR